MCCHVLSYVVMCCVVLCCLVSCAVCVLCLVSCVSRVLSCDCLVLSSYLTAFVRRESCVFLSCLLSYLALSSPYLQSDRLFWADLIQEVQDKRQEKKDKIRRKTRDKIRDKTRDKTKQDKTTQHNPRLETLQETRGKTKQGERQDKTMIRQDNDKTRPAKITTVFLPLLGFKLTLFLSARK
jgi:hypothetical protein